MSAFYNDNDHGVCAWLRSLMDEGHITPGVVDERSIEEVKLGDVKRYKRCHFFAGIGGWDYALQLAGWPADAHVWTASLPCQPFSQAGRMRAEADDRHLWPAFYRLLAQCRPPIVFGEQVASPLGRSWLASVRADLEALGYVVGSCDLCAASVGAPHIRQRLFWMGYSKCEGLEGLARNEDDHNAAGWEDQNPSGSPAQASVWSDPSFIECRDGKQRPIPTEPAFHPLAHGVPARVVRLRGYGNAIVPQVAAEFIVAAVEAIGDL